MNSPAMQKPNTNRISAHVIGTTEIEWINTAPDASDASPANTRM